jgi:hypothetical protein
MAVRQRVWPPRAQVRGAMASRCPSEAIEGGLGFGGGAGKLRRMHGDTATMARRCAAVF